MWSNQQLNFPKISFGIIILNGEPFTKYCLRSLYEFAYEIIVVEGGTQAAKKLLNHNFHSRDGTLDTLLRFKKEEDIDNKVKIITKDGYWDQFDNFGNMRTAQSQAYANVATGDYLWQIDIDEFYLPENIKRVLLILKNDPSITAISFNQKTFWRDINYIVDSNYLRNGAEEYHRLFKWGEGYKYITHEPPTVFDSLNRNTRSLNHIKGKEMEKKGIILYHYSLLFPKQVREKTKLYRDEGRTNAQRMPEWAEQNYFMLKDPYRVHNVYQYPSWIERFNKKHPPEILKMINDIKDGKIKIEMCPNRDVELLLKSFKYQLGIINLKIAYSVNQMKYKCINLLVFLKKCFWGQKHKHSSTL